MELNKFKQTIMGAFYFNNVKLCECGVLYNKWFNGLTHLNETSSDGRAWRKQLW